MIAATDSSAPSIDPILTHHQQTQNNSYMDSSTENRAKRIVIIQKDSQGYGMRISGDNPVFIQHVNEEGAAYRAGVRPGDQIVKVNGTLVTKLGHTEVVRMIVNGGSFVSLQLQPMSPSATNQQVPLSNSPPPTASSPTQLLPQQTILSAMPDRLIAPSTTSQNPTTAHVSSNSGQFSPPLFSINTNPMKHITGPQPVPQAKQQEFLEIQIRTLQEMINKELKHLDCLKMNNGPTSEMDRCQKLINDMKIKLEVLKNNTSAFIFNQQQQNQNNQHSRQHSFENDFNQATSTSLIGNGNKISADSLQVPSSTLNSGPNSSTTSPRILPMDDDVEIDHDEYEYISDDHLHHHSHGLEHQIMFDQQQREKTKPVAKSASNPTVSLRSNVSVKDKIKRDSKTLSSIFETGPVAMFSGATSIGQTGTITPSTTNHSKSPSSSSMTAQSQQQPSLVTSKAWYQIHRETLRLCRYLLEQENTAPCEVLFYTLAKNVFPKIVTTSIPPALKAQTIRRWAFQIISTFIVKDSPLFMQDYPHECLEKFEHNLTALISANPLATDVVASPFEPFLITICDKVKNQYEDFFHYMHSSSATATSQTTAKHDLTATLEILLKQTQPVIGFGSTATLQNINIQTKVDLGEIDKLLDHYLKVVETQRLESNIALISSLLAIGRYIFGITTSRHSLLLEPTISESLTSFHQLTLQSALNPVLKLSSDTSSNKKSSSKRNSMIPIGSKSSFTSNTSNSSNSFDASPNILSQLTNGSGNNSKSGTSMSSHTNSTSGNISGNVIEDRSHCFITITEMNNVLDCYHCMKPLWGDPYSLRCNKCLMYTHLWCRKLAAESNTCTNDKTITQNQQTTNSSSKRFRNKKETNNFFGKIGKKVSKRNRTDQNQFNSNSNLFSTGLQRQTSSCSATSSDSTSQQSSSSDSEDFNTPANFASINDDQESQQLSSHAPYRKNSKTTNQTSPIVLPGNDSSVNRSGSFGQRRKKKSSTTVGSPRKRSDPALTSKQISTISAVSGGTGEASQLTSARSSGALMNSASVGAHDCQIRPITGQRAKHMTASDSSLMSPTLTSEKMKLALDSGTTPSLLSQAINTDGRSQKSSITNLASTSSPKRTRHRNTNDSAIQMDGSESDDELPNDSISDPNKNDNEADIDLQPPESSPVLPPEPPPLPPIPYSQAEKCRQIQLEILSTEEEHVDALRHLRKYYQKPLKKEKLFTHEQISAIFGNIKDLLLTHKSILSNLKEANKQYLQLGNSPDGFYIEKAIFRIFCGELGLKLEDEAGKFCINRKIKNGIEIWNQRKKDPKLRNWFDSDAKARFMAENQFTRLGLDDLLSRVFQRPLRYPLLFERLLKSTPNDSIGYHRLSLALANVRESNKRINEVTEKAELSKRLSELVKKTDFTTFSPNSSITGDKLENEHELLYEGPLLWRITKQKVVDVLLVLTDRIILILTRESNGERRSESEKKSERYSLKVHQNPSTKMWVHRPEVKIDDLLLRDVATDSTAFFLVSKNQDIIYEFAATTTSEKNRWKDVITKAIANYLIKYPNESPTGIHHQHSQSFQLPTHKTFQSQRSMTMIDLKTPQTITSTATATTTPSSPQDHHDVAPPLPPPSILNRPLPPPPLPPQVSSPPPPLPPPMLSSPSSFLNRPLPRPPIEDDSVPQQPGHPQRPAPPVPSHFSSVTAFDCHPSQNEMIPFSKVKQSSLNDQPPLMTPNYKYLKLELDLVYDCMKHEDNHKEALSQMAAYLFRKATEWSFQLIQNDDKAKDDFKQTKNSIETFVKSYIDPSFNLTIPGENSEKSEDSAEKDLQNSESVNQDAEFNNEDKNINLPQEDQENETKNEDDDVNQPIDNLIQSISDLQFEKDELECGKQEKLKRVRRSLSDKSARSDKSQELTGPKTDYKLIDRVNSYEYISNIELDQEKQDQFQNFKDDFTVDHTETENVDVQLKKQEDVSSSSPPPPPPPPDESSNSAMNPFSENPVPAYLLNSKLNFVMRESSHYEM